MDTTKLKKFAQFARRTLIEQVGARLEAVRAEGSTAQREHPKAFKALEAKITQHGEDELVERVAYIWFNRFTALRFLDVNELSAVRVVSPLPGQFQPEVLADAKAGNIDEQLVPAATRRKVRELLDGLTPSQDPQAEAYRLLLVAICNSWQTTMPFLFERIDDYTELLLPADLLSNASILAYMREAMTPDACQDVEIIGWLYQFYISEKKDQVFAGLKKNQKITAENIPAATQLFTPHWIVRYLVENSLGRLWLLNRPGSKLAERMDYYITPEEPETDFLKIGKPEEIKLCDPACGSGHMLTYAFDLLYAIYEEEGYEADKIPALILANNLTGLEIDDRAGALAAFALAMKAAARLGRRRFLRMEVKPDIVSLQNVSFTPAEMQDVAAVVGRDLFTDELRETLGQFEQAKNFGSLIVPKLRDPAETLRIVEAREFEGDLLLREVQARVSAVLRMAEALSPRYHVVLANPPYMGAAGMNATVTGFLSQYYPAAKADTFAAFILRSDSLLLRNSYAALITPTTWMFIATYKNLRDRILTNGSIECLVQMEYNSGFIGAVAPVCAYVLRNTTSLDRTGVFISLKEFKGYELQSPKALEAIKLRNCAWRYRRSGRQFLSLKGREIAFDIQEGFAQSLSRGYSLGNDIIASEGIKTSDNSKYIRFWHEVSHIKLSYYADDAEWVRHAKGGDFRKWYGNLSWAIKWSGKNGVKHEPRAGFQGLKNFDRFGVCWSKISNAYFAARAKPEGMSFDSAAPAAFVTRNLDSNALISILCSKPIQQFIMKTNPTMNFQVGNVQSIPLPMVDDWQKAINKSTSQILLIAKSDWDAYETSWDFATLPLLSPGRRADTLDVTYTHLRAHWLGMTNEMQRLEEENNRIFIDAYGLQDELTPEVPMEEITLTCNPAYRYGVKPSEEEREKRLLADTMAEFLSYAVGCMFGRYSLDAPGLILANQGETLADYLARVPNPNFLPDKDNVIPVLEGDWFADDIVDRFRRFLRVTFGEAHFRDNLAFIEAQIGDVRRYFTKSFYEDHVKRYKKRPIYWMFSSPKGTFQALIYMHRYRSDTVSVLLNDYLREFIRKLWGERTRLEKIADDTSASQSQRTRALKDGSTVTKQIAELEEWEREVIFPLAQAKIEIDLDDGVKRNYPKFGAALKTIKGLEEADE
jgi:hypothetical protein